jgi:hypothetical protein
MTMRMQASDFKQGDHRRTLGMPVLPDVYTTVATSSARVGTAIWNVGSCGSTHH